MESRNIWEMEVKRTSKMDWMLVNEGEEAKFNCHISNEQLIDRSAIYEEELRRSSLLKVMEGTSLDCYVNKTVRRIREVNFN